MSRLPKLSDIDIPEEAKPLFDFAKNMKESRNTMVPICRIYGE